MKVILKKDVSNLGEEDAVVMVSDGYARNYLIPQGWAVAATKACVAAAEKRRAEKAKIMAGKKAEFEETAQKLSLLEIEILADAGEGGKLFGSVTSQDIAAAVKEKAGIEIDKKKIELSDPLKVLGEYAVPVKIFQDISANLRIKVIAR